MPCKNLVILGQTVNCSWDIRAAHFAMDKRPWYQMTMNDHGQRLWQLSRNAIRAFCLIVVISYLLFWSWPPDSNQKTCRCQKQTESCSCIESLVQDCQGHGFRNSPWRIHKKSKQAGNTIAWNSTRNQTQVFYETVWNLLNWIQDLHIFSQYEIAAKCCNFQMTFPK